MDRDLNDAQFFVSVIDLGSFSKVARKLDVPVSTVSRRITRLEERLGVKLLVRTTRLLRPTDAGILYHTSAKHAVDTLERAERDLFSLGDTPRGRVRVTAPLGVAHGLWPVIEEFLHKFPDVQVEIDGNDQSVDLVKAGYNLALRVGPLPDSTLIARELLVTTHQLFASPTYLNRRGAPVEVEDLKSHDCIIRGKGKLRSVWSLRRDGRETKVTVSGRVTAAEMGLALRATVSGFGIGCLPHPVAAEALASRAIVRVMEEFDGGDAPLWLVHTEGHALPAAVRAMANHLAARAPVILGRI